MSVENFFTTQAQTLPPQGQKPANNAGKGASGTESFIDIILARIAENLENAKNNADTENADRDSHTLLDSDNPALDKNPKLDLAELLAANPEIEEELKDFIAATQLGPEAELTQVLALNQQAFDDVLKPLTDGIITSEEIANGSPRILQAFLIEGSEGEGNLALDIKSLREKIKAAIEGDKNALTITNLTPEQLATIQNLPEGAELPEELAGNPFIAIIQLLPPQGENASDDPTLQNLVAVLVSPANQAGIKNQGQADPLAARLNALNVGGGEARFTIEEYEGTLQLLQNNDGKGKGADGQDFSGLLKNANQNAGSPSPDLSFLQAGAFSTAGSLLSPFGFSQEMLDQYGLNTASTATSTLGTLTSAITQAQSASSPHPAMQMVAVNIQKAAGRGENKTLTLQLDPPELGRVQVKLEFGADKALKTVVTAEKPETFMMMQRDVQALERALQDAGLDTSDGLNFELAEHGFDFDQDNQRGGGHDKGGTGAGDEAEDGEEIIESTMTWNVDPESGHTRYDILA